MEKQPVRPIDANRLLESIKEVIENFKREGEEVASLVANAAAKIIENEKCAPTLDCEPVIRCKDCKHSRTDNSVFTCTGLRCDHPNLCYDIECFDHWIEVKPDDFCSCGTKMDGGKEDAVD